MNTCTRIAVYLTATPDGGGSFQYADSILHALSSLPKDQFQIYVWSPRLESWKSLLQEKGLTDVCFLPPLKWYQKWFGLGNRIFKLPGIRGLNLGRFWQYLHPHALAIAAWKPNICIFTQQSILSLPRSIMKIAPIHDLMHKFFLHFPEVGEKKEIQSREQLFNTIASTCSVILAESQVGKEHILQFYPAAKNRIHVLPLIPPRSLLQAQPVRPVKLPETFTDRFLFYPAQFWMHKNHMLLLEAIKNLADDLNIHCVFSGDTNKNGYAPFVEKIKTLGLGKRIHVLGYVTNEELAWLYANAHCMVMPTYFGPTNIPPLEAMHLGCPMALSGNFGMPDQCQEAAVYFNPSKVDEISQAICQVWQNEQLRHTMKEAGKRLSAAWQPVNFEQQFLNIFYELLKKE